MINDVNALHDLLAACLDEGHATRLTQRLAINPVLTRTESGQVSRAVIAQALAMVLFDDLLARVPAARDYAESVAASGGKIVFDHGALRTVDSPHCGALPRGVAAFHRILKPLGYEVAAIYPLPRIAMTGRAYRHRDYPEDIPQFFVSELHTERFSPPFQDAAARVLSSSRDPLTPRALRLLTRLKQDQALTMDEATSLVTDLIVCFDRQHDVPRLDDYETLLRESPEMAWIATEGNAFNHATDRVTDVVSLAEAQRQAGRPIKDAIEVSTSGRVRQTAFKAALVEREFVDSNGLLTRRSVPGSYYEFITRDSLPDGSGLDLAFDSANAQGIFKMTSTR